MAKFTVRYRAVCYGEVDVEAGTPEEAEATAAELRGSRVGSLLLKQRATVADLEIVSAREKGGT